MVNFFASMYEFWGNLQLYSTDLADHLRGWDITCTCYCGTPVYSLIGWIMVGIVIVFYALQYHILDSVRYMRVYHWWITCLVLALINYLVAFTWANNALQSLNYCEDLIISTSDCLGFGLANALWSIILFILITSFPIPRRFSSNCSGTTFWKP